MRRPSELAFSLVELSIVLVILGLLVGGVLSGQSLIRASELRSVTQEMGKFNTAIYSFRDKYFALPGDITNATAFWGKNNALCPGAAGTASATGTCNGNGDGLIGDSVKGAGEMFLVWQHLAAAGLIEGSYTGVVGPNGTYDSLRGVNSPAGKISGLGYDILACVGWGDPLYPCNPGYYPNTHNTVLLMGFKLPADVNQVAFLKPAEAWNIDTKVDDGKPGLGTYHTYRPSMYSGLNNGNCTSSDDPNVAVYNLDKDEIACSFVVGL